MEKNNNNFILKRIQNFLYSFYAKETDDARLSEIYDGLVKALMQDIGKNWTKSKKIFKNKALSRILKAPAFNKIN